MDPNSFYNQIANLFQDHQSIQLQRPTNESQSRTIRESINFNCRIEVRGKGVVHPYDVVEFVLRTLRNQTAYPISTLKKIAMGFLHIWNTEGTLIYNTVRGLITIIETISFDYETPTLPLQSVVAVQHSGAMRTWGGVYMVGHFALTATPVATNIHHPNIQESQNRTSFLMLEMLLGIHLDLTSIGIKAEELSNPQFLTLYEILNNQQPPPFEARNIRHQPSAPPLLEQSLYSANSPIPNFAADSPQPYNNQLTHIPRSNYYPQFHSSPLEENFAHMSITRPMSPPSLLPVTTTSNSIMTTTTSTSPSSQSSHTRITINQRPLSQTDSY